MTRVVNKRPMGTIVVLVYQVLGALLVVPGLVFGVVFGAASPWHAFGAIGVALRVAGAIALVRLSRAGVWLLTMDVILQTIALVAVLLQASRVAAAPIVLMTRISTVLVYGIAICICVYSWRLDARGLLK